MLTGSKRKIVEKGFVENVDYVTKDKIVERKTTRGATVSKEYYLTVDTAKNVCMMENTDTFVVRCV